MHKPLQSFATMLFSQYEQLLFFQLYEHILSSSRSQTLWPHHLPWPLVRFRQKNVHRWPQNGDSLHSQLVFDSLHHTDRET